MKVKELIELLVECDPEAEVLINTEDDEDPGIQYGHDIQFQSGWKKKECSGKPNYIGLFAIHRPPRYP